MTRQTGSEPIGKPPSVPRGNPNGCVEVLGGNEARTQALVVAGVELLLVARPAGAKAGGDLYCIHSCGDRSQAKIVLVDIQGHGQRSAPLARSIHNLLHEFSRETNPTRLLEQVNQRFTAVAPPAVLATSLCGVYESQPGKFRYTYGGQPGILFWQAGIRHWKSLTPSWDTPCGLPFGIADTSCYEEEAVSLSPGEMLLMFSDGVLETHSQTGALLQVDGVLRLAQECTEALAPGFPLPPLATAFLNRLVRFHGGSEFEDDLTMLWVRRLPDSRPTGWPRGGAQ